MSVGILFREQFRRASRYTKAVQPIGPVDTVCLAADLAEICFRPSRIGPNGTKASCERAASLLYHIREQGSGSAVSRVWIL